MWLLALGGIRIAFDRSPDGHYTGLPLPSQDTTADPTSDPTADPAADPSPPEALSLDVGAMRRRSEEHCSVDLPLPALWLRHVLSDTDADVPAAGRFTFTLTLQPRGIGIVQGQLVLQFSVPCGRCLDAAQVDGSATLCATYLPAATAAQRYAVSDDDDEDGLALHEDDLDSWAYEGTTLELAPLVAEHVRLAYPMRALCPRGEACRGLCSNCGAPLNALPESVLECAECKNAVPALPVGPRVAPAPGPRPPEKVGSLAAALKKAGFEPTS